MSDDVTKKDIEDVLKNSPKTKGKEIVWPSMERVKELRPWIDEIIKAIGVKGAFVSDKSSIGDFSPLFEDGGYDDIPSRTSLKKLSEALGVEVQFGDHLVDVAERMRAKVKKL